MTQSKEDGAPARAFLPVLVAAAIAIAVLPAQQRRVPGATWQQFGDVREAGFDQDALLRAHGAWRKLPSSAFLVVADGAVVAAWGDVERRFKCHSVRKSLLSALYGIYYDRGAIELNKTLADIGIDDHPDPLLETERRARILDLLKARSGVFHPAAYAGRTDARPRGSEGPGRYFAYNNWDFNTLAAILKKETGADVFEAFDEHFGRPLQLQDWRMSDGYYHYERDKSSFPAYPFRMSARDLARVGVLFAREGIWGERRILSKNWVRRSTTEYSIDSDVMGYGFMWWVLREERFQRHGGGFAASGVGNQKVVVFPELDLVIVNRANTYDGEATPMAPLLDLVEQVVLARTGPPAATPKLVEMPDGPPHPARTVVTAAALAPYVGEWQMPPAALGLPVGPAVSLAASDGHLLLFAPTTGTFKAFVQPDGTLFLGDSQRRLHAVRDDADRLLGFADSGDFARAAVHAMARSKPERANELLQRAGDLPEPIAATVRLILRVVATQSTADVAAMGDEVRELMQALGRSTIARQFDRTAGDLLEHGHPAAAQRLYEALRQVFPDVPRVWQRLAATREAAGDRPGAIAALERLLKITPDDAMARAELARLRQD